MATLLTSDVIAREALANLYAQTVMLPLVHRDYSSEFANVGDTVTIRKPATFESTEFTSTISAQTITETSTSVVLDKHYDVSFEVTSKEMTLDITDFREQLIAPAMEAHAQKIDQLLCGLYVDVYPVYGTAGTTPGVVADITGTRRVLQENNVPMADRRFVVGPAAEDKMLQQEAFTNMSWAGAQGLDALNDAALGRRYGFDFFAGQNVASHVNGVSHTGTFALNGAVAAAATTASIDATTITGTWAKGSMFTVAGDTTTYIVTADKAAAANALTNFTFSPAAPTGGWADGTVVTRIADHVANLAFHRNAFAFVSRPLALPMGGVSAQIETYKGLSVRVVYDYNSSTKKNIISLDILFGVKTLDPLRAVRVLG